MSSEERTAFLADNEHTGSDEHHEGSLVLQKLPANAHFKRPLRILTSITALLSILILGLLIAILVILKTGRFTWNYSAIDAVKGGIIVVRYSTSIFSFFTNTFSYPSTRFSTFPPSSFNFLFS